MKKDKLNRKAKNVIPKFEWMRQKKIVAHKHTHRYTQTHTHTHNITQVAHRHTSICVCVLMLQHIQYVFVYGTLFLQFISLFCLQSIHARFAISFIPNLIHFTFAWFDFTFVQFHWVYYTRLYVHSHGNRIEWTDQVRRTKGDHDNDDGGKIITHSLEHDLFIPWAGTNFWSEKKATPTNKWT